MVGYFSKLLLISFPNDTGINSTWELDVYFPDGEARTFFFPSKMGFVSLLISK